MFSVLGFILILGPLVVVHELGHFLFARLFGVKAEVFSVGFGPTIWSRQKGETEWKISAIPLGGYVKLLGEEPGKDLPPAELARSLQKARPWKRFLIFAGGPLFNFILAAIVFMSIQVIGEEQPRSIVGRVLPGSVAATAGLRVGDEIIEVASAPVRTFEEMMTAFGDHPGRPVEFKVRREGSASPLVLSVTPSAEPGYNHFGEKVPVGDVGGLLVMGREPIVGVSDSLSAAARAGIRTGDRILSWNGTRVSTYEQLEQLHAGSAPGQTVSLEVEPAPGRKCGEAACPKVLTLGFARSPARRTLGEETGLHSSELFVDKTVGDSPASRAGLLRGDRLVSVNRETLSSFFDLREKVQKAGDAGLQVRLSWERLASDGKGGIIESEIVPNTTELRDPELKKTRQFTVGVYPMMVAAAPLMIIERTLNPFVVVYRGFARMLTMSWRNFVSIGKMFTGGVSVKTLGGPILIGKIAGESITRGLIAFLGTMAILSIGLGVLNILPVPLLDGGHILLLGLEVIRGRPLRESQMELFQKVGLALILLLMVVVMKNDLTRIF